MAATQYCIVCKEKYCDSATVQFRGIASNRGFIWCMCILFICSRFFVRNAHARSLLLIKMKNKVITDFIQLKKT